MHRFVLVTGLCAKRYQLVSLRQYSVRQSDDSSTVVVIAYSRCPPLSAGGARVEGHVRAILPLLQEHMVQVSTLKKNHTYGQGFVSVCPAWSV